MEQNFKILTQDFVDLTVSLRSVHFECVGVKNVKKNVFTDSAINLSSLVSMATIIANSYGFHNKHFDVQHIFNVSEHND